MTMGLNISNYGMLDMPRFKSITPPPLDSLNFNCKTIRSADDALNLSHYILNHLDTPGCNAKVIIRQPLIQVCRNGSTENWYNKV